MPGALLDSHTLYWLVSGAEPLTDNALVAIGQNQATETLFVSPITAWELSIAAQKPKNATQFGNGTPTKWFREAVQATASKIIPVRQTIALEAAAIVTETGHKDPGDCFLIATARIRKIPIVTRDTKMRELAEQGFIDVIVC